MKVIKNFFLLSIALIYGVGAPVFALEKIVVIGGGPAGLFAAQKALEQGFRVELFDNPHSRALPQGLLLVGGIFSELRPDVISNLSQNSFVFNLGPFGHGVVSIDNLRKALLQSLITSEYAARFSVETRRVEGGEIDRLRKESALVVLASGVKGIHLDAQFKDAFLSQYKDLNESAYVAVYKNNVGPSVCSIAKYAVGSIACGVTPLITPVAYKPISKIDLLWPWHLNDLQTTLSFIMPGMSYYFSKIERQESLETARERVYSWYSINHKRIVDAIIQKRIYRSRKFYLISEEDPSLAPVVLYGDSAGAGDFFRGSSLNTHAQALKSFNQLLLNISQKTLALYQRDYKKLLNQGLFSEFTDEAGWQDWPQSETKED